MKKTMLIFIILTIFYQCNSQNKEKNRQPVEDTSFTKVPNQKYFVGTWYVVEKSFTHENTKEIQPQSNCEKKSYWKFIEEKGILKQSKFTAKGKDCSEYISTTTGRVIFKDYDFQYFTDDVLYSEKIKVISDKKFAIITSDYIAGKPVQIEKIYQKK